MKYKITFWENNNEPDTFTGTVEELMSHGWFDLRDFLSDDEFNALLIIIEGDNFTKIEFVDLGVEDLRWVIEPETI